MSIITGDIHGRIDKAKAFLAYKPNDPHVALGDYLDSFSEPPERQLEVMRLLMESPAVLLFGNHELHYLSWPLFQFPGYNEPWADEFNQVLESNINRFRPSVAVNGWLCTHAGGAPWLAVENSIDELDCRFNAEWQAFLADRAGGYRYKSIFTFDFMRSAPVPAIRQVHGHDEHIEPGFTSPVCVSLGCNDPGTCWIFDTETNEVKDIGV